MKLKEWEIINQKTLIIIGVLCTVFVITTSGILQYYTSVVSDKDQQINSLCEELTSLDAETHELNTTVTTLTEALTQKNNVISQKNDEINSLNSQITSLNSQITSLNSQIAELEETTGEATLVANGLTVEDVRFGSSYYLRVYGRVNNTGSGTAYNAGLHVTAYNAEGRAINTYHSFGGVTAGMSLGLDFSIEYTGSPIQNWQITPIWTNTFVIPVTGTFPP